MHEYRSTTLSDHFIKSKSCLQTVAPPMDYSKDRSNDAHEDERSVYFDTKHPSPNEYPKKGHFSPHLVHDDDNSHSSKSREQSRTRSMSREVYFDRVRSRSPQRDLRLKLTSDSAGRQYTKDRSVTPAKR